MLEPRNLFPLLALIFGVVGLGRLLRAGGKLDPAARTWLLMAVIFVLVSIWLRNPS